MYSLVKQLETEISNGNIPFNTPVNQLIQGFIKYLKEPRYQTPLSINELSQLFSNFYKDLNATVITTYTQSNNAKKSLISGSEYFKNHPKMFDYLLAIANYSSSSIKLVKRTDQQALAQLRIFNLYKFLVVLNIIEKSQESLLKLVNNHDDISLYDKIFRFHEKDMVVEDYFKKKITALKSLNLRFESFVEKDIIEKHQKLIDFINNCESNDQVNEAIKRFSRIKTTLTAHGKLRIIGEFQKTLLVILSKYGDLPSHNINNDILLPVLIYLIIYKLDNLHELCLTFNYIKHFTNFIDPYNVSILGSTSFFFYNPSETLKNSTKNQTVKKTTIFDCVNLNETNEDTSNAEILPVNDPENDILSLPFFPNDKQLIQHLNTHYLNNSELQYYLTNFEAVLFFIQNVTADELTDEKTGNVLLEKPLSVFIDEELSTKFEFPTKDPESHENDKELVENRSRSSSLINTITNRFNEAARSRSNSGMLKSRGNSLPFIDTNINTNEGSPLHSPNDDNSTSFNMMRNIIGRFGSVSVLQFRNLEEEEGLINPKHNRSSSIIEKLSPNHTRTHSASLENVNLTVSNSNTLSNTISPTRKNTIASKLSSGVTDLMTKFNGPPNGLNHSLNHSQTSLKSLDEQEAQLQAMKRPDHRGRTASMQIMEKWFNNLSAGQQPQNVDKVIKPEPANDSESHESVFSTPSKELARYHNVDFDSLTILDLRTLKVYYDQLCTELGVNESKLSDLNDQVSSVNSI